MTGRMDPGEIDLGGIILLGGASFRCLYSSTSSTDTPTDLVFRGFVRGEKVEG